MKNVVILGAGGHAHVIADIVSSQGDKVIAFLDDDCINKKCSGPISDYVKYSDCEFIIGVGNTDVREKLSSLNVVWHTAIHHSAIISPTASIGVGTVIMPGVVINSSSAIGNHCIINTGAIIEHDNVIKDFAHISVGVRLGGTVEIGEKTWIGIGTVVSNNIKVTDNVIVGAGSLVIKNIENTGIYYGSPVKRKE